MVEDMRVELMTMTLALKKKDPKLKSRSNPSTEHAVLGGGL